MLDVQRELAEKMVFSTVQGWPTSTHATRALAAIHSLREDSFGPNVIRFPDPTRRRTVPGASCRRQPSVKRRVEPSAFPLC
jgi:hypothetical protein